MGIVWVLCVNFYILSLCHFYRERVQILKRIVLCFIRSDVIVKPRSQSRSEPEVRGWWPEQVSVAQREREWLQSTSLDSVPGHTSPASPAPEQQKHKLHILFIKL